MLTATKSRKTRRSAGVAAALASAAALLLVSPAAASDGRATAQQAPPEAGLLAFYEGDNASQDVLCRIPFRYGTTVNFQTDNLGCENDEARSVRVDFLPPGASFTIHDSPSCSWSDDVSAVTVTDPDAYNARFTVPRFDFTGGTWQYNITYHRDNGIQGKVSCIRMNYPS